MKEAFASFFIFGAWPRCSEILSGRGIVSIWDIILWIA